LGLADGAACALHDDDEPHDDILGADIPKSVSVSPCSKQAAVECRIKASDDVCGASYRDRKEAARMM